MYLTDPFLFIAIRNFLDYSWRHCYRRLHPGSCERGQTFSRLGLHKFRAAGRLACGLVVLRRSLASLVGDLGHRNDHLVRLFPVLTLVELTRLIYVECVKRCVSLLFKYPRPWLEP